MTNRVLQRDDNFLAAVRAPFGDFDNDRAVIATARRKGKGNLWYIWIREYTTGTQLKRNPTVHARVSGKLPEHVQQKLVRSILESI